MRGRSMVDAGNAYADAKEREQGTGIVERLRIEADYTERAAQRGAEGDGPWEHLGDVARDMRNLVPLIREAADHIQSIT